MDNTLLFLPFQLFQKAKYQQSLSVKALMRYTRAGLPRLENVNVRFVCNMEVGLYM